MKVLTLRCAGTPQMSWGEQLRSAILMIASAVAISVSYAWIKRITGGSLFLDALGIAVFPMAVIVGMMPIYLRERSTAARIVLIAILLILVYLGSLFAAWM